MARPVRHLLHPSDTTPPVPPDPNGLPTDPVVPLTLCRRPVVFGVSTLDLATHQNPPTPWYVATCRPCLAKLAARS